VLIVAPKLTSPLKNHLPSLLMAKPPPLAIKPLNNEFFACFDKIPNNVKILSLQLLI